MDGLPHPPGRPKRAFIRRSIGLAVLLSVCLPVALVAAIALDGHMETVRRKKIAASRREPDRSSLKAPTPGDWGVPLFPVGTPAPSFRLTDVRTGLPVSLEEYRNRCPVVLLLSSFG
jgi:hypothetical protein